MPALLGRYAGLVAPLILTDLLLNLLDSFGRALVAALVQLEPNGDKEVFQDLGRHVQYSRRSSYG